MISTTVDPDGRRVVLSEPAWDHIKKRRRLLAGCLREIMAAVHEPTARLSGQEEGEEWFYLEGAGPARWLKVVVHYEGGEGWIVTAFPRRSLP